MQCGGEVSGAVVFHVSRQHSLPAEITYTLSSGQTIHYGGSAVDCLNPIDDLPLNLSLVVTPAIVDQDGGKSGSIGAAMQRLRASESTTSRQTGRHAKSIESLQLDRTRYAPNKSVADHQSPQRNRYFSVTTRDGRQCMERDFERINLRASSHARQCDGHVVGRVAWSTCHEGVRSCDRHCGGCQRAQTHNSRVV
ncbi:hypothetical protein CA85_18600 [Allorhodopirellula solitaria]|uniref:Uncharacterized protein n=1 Tax=Allorhodopirellula solitaria TaxID=2527987 RepID=A0A5C5YDF7_9BACT|nr:hypothetical protein CA85_18600 [Allorhodopirellula solitaria]